jgi:glucosamine--fructose-6-phosphate aminotransferase (isomerizing)
LSWTSSEIREQPLVLERILRENPAQAKECARQIKDRGVRYVLIAARGTSDHAAVYAKYLLGSKLRLPVALAAPSLYTFYGTPPLTGPDALVVGLSQSGASEDIIAVVRHARSQGALTLAITNEPTSELANAASLVLPCLAGPERGVAATKTYTAELACVALLCASVAQESGLFAELAALPEAMDQALQTEQAAAQVAAQYCRALLAVCLGRGYNLATAYEIALKIKELAYIHAQGYSTADFMHGPLACVEPGLPVIAVAMSGALRDDVAASLSRVGQRGGQLIIISDDEAILQSAHASLPVPKVPEWLSPITAVVPGQWLAVHLALAKGLDPDRPRALTKVTVTR